jgi:hypothetical protein
VQFTFVAVLLSLSDGRSTQAPPEPVTRFRAVEGYSLFITVKSDDDMKVEFQGELLQRKYKETFTARIDLTERHLDNDLVEWTGEGVAEQVLEEKRKEVRKHDWPEGANRNRPFWQGHRDLDSRQAHTQQRAKTGPCHHLQQGHRPTCGSALLGS